MATRGSSWGPQNMSLVTLRQAASGTWLMGSCTSGGLCGLGLLQAEHTLHPALLYLRENGCWWQLSPSLMGLPWWHQVEYRPVQGQHAEGSSCQGPRGGCYPAAITTFPGTILQDAVTNEGERCGRSLSHSQGQAKSAWLRASRGEGTGPLTDLPPHLRPKSPHLCPRTEIQPPGQAAGTQHSCSDPNKHLTLR